MFIASHNKNPLINFERKSLKQQKSQKSLGSKFPKYAGQKCMKLENKWKRKGNMVLPALGEKNLAKRSEENNKKLVGCLDRSNRERKSFEKFEKCLNTWKRKVFKKLSIRLSIDRKIGSFDWKCFNWSNINWAPIKTDRGWPKF